MEERVVVNTGKKRKKRTKRIALYTLRRTWHHTIVDHRHKPLTTVENPKPQIRRTLTDETPGVLSTVWDGVGFLYTCVPQTITRWWHID